MAYNKANNIHVMNTGFSTPERYQKEIGILNFLLMYTGSSLASLEANTRFFKGERGIVELNMYKQIQKDGII